MFVSIVGQAIFHTARRSGPSTIDRSYLRPVDPGGEAGRSASLAGVDLLIASLCLSVSF
jgi:hypothetical protein